MEGKKDKAAKVLAKVEKEIPEYNVPISYVMSGGTDLAWAYNKLGQKAKALSIIEKMWKNSLQYANWYLSLSDRGFGLSQNDCYMHFQIMLSLIQTADEIDTTWGDKHEPQLQALVDKYQQRGGSRPQ